MIVSCEDRSVLRRLAERVAEIGSLPVRKETARAWRRLNALETGRPLLWINEICWHEMNVNDELTLQCKDDFCRGVERNLREKIYQWEHLRADMVVDPIYYSPLAISSTGFGIHQEGELLSQGQGSGLYSHQFEPQINNEKDIEKIKNPIITHDVQTSERNYQTLMDAFGDILPVKKQGIVHSWFAPWDELIRWWGVENAMMDIITRPELVHLAMDRLVSGHLSMLEQWEDLNLLSLTDGNYRVGSGGLGYSDDIPAPGFNAERVRPIDQWGCATAQIFSSVSPEMHEEFALRYERRWLERFAVTYYGCCEPLHNKLGVLSSIPNLRKVSMSPWSDVEKAAPLVAGKYVFSHKPNPAVFAVDAYNPEQARKNLVDVLDRTKGCVVEVILKDISTVRNDPRRLWQWAEMVMEVVQDYA